MMQHPPLRTTRYKTNRDNLVELLFNPRLSLLHFSVYHISDQYSQERFKCRPSWAYSVPCEFEKPNIELINLYNILLHASDIDRGGIDLTISLGHHGWRINKRAPSVLFEEYNEHYSCDTWRLRVPIKVEGYSYSFVDFVFYYCYL